LNTLDPILIIAALLLSAMCSGLEIAFISSNKLYFELQRKQGAFWTRLVEGFFRRPAKLIGTLLVGNNIALVVYGIAMARVLEPWLASFLPGDLLVMVAQTVVSTLVILVLAEFLPKTLFRLDPNGAMAFFALPMRVLHIILWLPTTVLTGISEVLLRVFGMRTKPGQLTFGRIDLDAFLREVSENTGTMNDLDAEVEYFRNTLELSQVKVRELMVPRAEIVAMDVDTPVKDLLERFSSTGLSKVLVYKNGIDNMIGYVHSYEMFRKPRSIRAVMRPVNFVPGTMPADELLQMFIKQRSHMAVVVDEFGGTAGVLTMEDVVEHIVGDIEDEHDQDLDVEERLGPHEFLFSARLEVEYLVETHGLQLPISEEYDTLAGLILYHSGEIPGTGEEIEVGPFRFTIAKVSQNRIELVRCLVLDPAAGIVQ
jgi:putative hemolysin